jgi:uncharacterized protein YndB with AHSA1/START domain
MFSIVTSLHVGGLSGREITDFLSTCTDEAFRRWWPGTHFQLHTMKGTPGSVGSVVYMDEMIGNRRVKVTCELVDLVPGRKLVWQLRRPLFRLPVRLVLRLKDDDTGVQIEQSIQAGFSGFAGFLDPAFRLFFSTGFGAGKDEHVRTEFPKLRDFLRKGTAE